MTLDRVLPRVVGGLAVAVLWCWRARHACTQRGGALAVVVVGYACVARR